MIVLSASCALVVGFELKSLAQEASPDAGDRAPQQPTIPPQRKHQHKQQSLVKQIAATAAPTPAAPSFAASLVKAGAGACAKQVDALAGATMGGVATYNTAAHWSLARPETRPVSVFIGQKFAAAGVPYGASGVFAAPNGQGGCDGMSVQVVPSPLSCAKLRETLSSRGKQVGDLAGIPLMEDAGSQTMLVPTAADTCVLVGVRTAYAK